MYSREDRKKAVDLWLKYGKRSTAVVNELGYPCSKILKKWHQEFIQEKETGVINERNHRTKKYSEAEKSKAVQHFLEHGRCLAVTRRALGYPCQELLSAWCKEFSDKQLNIKKSVLDFSNEQKQEAVIDLCCRKGPAKTIAEVHSTSRTSLYKWKNVLLGKELRVKKSNNPQNGPMDEKQNLLSEIENLQEQVQRLTIQKEILEGAAELIKKDPGVDLKGLSNQEKTSLIVALNTKYPLNLLLELLFLSRSSYYYQLSVLKAESKYILLKKKIVEVFNLNHRCYGYRRIHLMLMMEGIRVSEKVIRTLMVEESLTARPKRKRKYSSYQGEISPAPENLIDRNFNADCPNQKWLTDITEFHLPAGKVYLSPIIDCFDGMVVSWSVSTRPDAELVNTMLDRATEKIPRGIKTILHSDRGCHYRWPGWLDRVEKASLVRSMSKKGCSPDNSACEGFFGRLKNEMFYKRNWKGISVETFMEALDSYIRWYNTKRIKMSLGGRSPAQYRFSLGLVV